MSQKIISSFLTSMFEDKNIFMQINGTENTMDAKYMLIADALSENISLLSEVIGEHLNLNTNSINSINRNETHISVAF